ncbi:CHASE2 domain-containing protein [Microvirga terrestris]|uniref:Adenylate/guanylate cyclase domain-containing protein n=1 Tax=Microvirga terrestris TaxID=2791024 RepID=A0ABS0HMF6_9HYPH|nr:adenylate/guanylate cyclase domain-containing protein [Microvirga terrestris]MBF9194661.1 adenylate/guanylate cyclase domain-containing protein [Microvirga terrestris]
MGRRYAIPLIAAALAGVWGAGLAILHWQGKSALLDRLEAPLVDLRFLIQGPRPAPDGITILAIDDQTVQQVGAYPLPRTTMAQLVSKVGRMQPKAVALDILFVDPGPAEGDLALAKALGETRGVLAAAGLFDRNVPYDADAAALNDLPMVQRLLLPIETLASASAVGVVNIATDPSGVPRHIPLLVRSNSQIIPSFPLRTVSVAMGQDPVLRADEVAIGDVATSTERGYALPLRFYGPSGTVRTISASEVLDGQADEDAFRGRIVVIGATVTGGGDAFPTPFDPVLPGVEVLATAMAHLMDGDGLVRDRRVRFADGCVAILLPILFVLLLAWHRGIWGFAVIALVTAAWIGLTFAAFTRGIWLSATLPLLAALPPAIVFGAAELWLDRRRADRLSVQSRTLRRFQPPSLTRRLAEDPAFLMKPVRQKVAVIFIDLSGFTGLSELLPLDETREMLRGFHALVDQEAVRHQGIVASFMGDGAMILFGLPDSSPEDACHAVEACVGLCLRTEVWMADLPDTIASQIGFKIGAHFGEIIASRLGGDSHQHITAVGDTVNVASRLMEVAASHDADVALSDDLHRAAGDGCSIFESGLLEGTFPTAIRGRSGSIPIWLWRRSHTHMHSGSGERHRSPS